MIGTDRGQHDPIVTDVVEEIKGLIGKEVGVGDWITIDQSRIDLFADATEDRQWIHVDEEQARAGPFGATIGHGFLSLSLIPRLGAGVEVAPLARLKRTMILNYGLNRVRFLAPVTVGSRIRSHVVVRDVALRAPDRILLTLEHTIEIEGEEKPACVAEQLGLHIIDVAR